MSKELSVEELKQEVESQLRGSAFKGHDLSNRPDVVSLENTVDDVLDFIERAHTLGYNSAQEEKRMLAQDILNKAILDNEGENIVLVSDINELIEEYDLKARKIDQP